MEDQNETTPDAEDYAARRICRVGGAMYSGPTPLRIFPPVSLAAQRALRDVFAAGQVFQVVEPHLCFVHALLQEFNAVFKSYGYVAFSEIYAARCIPETSGIFNRLQVFMELSLSAFKFIAQIRCLLGIPLGVLGFHVRSRLRFWRWRFFVRCRRRFRLLRFFVNLTHDGNQARNVAKFFEVVVGPNHCVLAVRSCARLVCRAQRNSQGTQGH